MLTLDLVFQDDFIKNDERKGKRRRQAKPVLVETLSFLRASICDTCYADFYPPNNFFFCIETQRFGILTICIRFKDKNLRSVMELPFMSDCHRIDKMQ